ncbi:hypothetical protein [Kaistella sp.]|uniref:hypothetical protein n=1 Tax=Kaistella sp. TaxID=2782235 RepID=UPI00359FE3AD
MGFENLVRTKPEKVSQIFKIFDNLNVFKHPLLQVIVFSDTVLVFNKDDSWSKDYYVTYLIEFAQEMFYNLSLINVYFRAIITLGKFHFFKYKNFQSYYGEALIETYNDESQLEGFGLFINKNLTNEVIVFDKIEYNEKYDFILLCQSYINLFDDTKGKLPIQIDMFTETDKYYRIDEDLRFFREIQYLKDNYPSPRIRRKYQVVYDIYKERTKEFFRKFEDEGFTPFTLNMDYMGSLSPFYTLAEEELQTI